MKQRNPTHNGDDQFNRHVKAIKEMKMAKQLSVPLFNSAYMDGDGLASLQQHTLSLMNSKPRQWGFTGSNFTVRRQRLDNGRWKITVENPKTREIILEAEGHGDKVFANEDNLAKMAEALTEQGLKITT